MYSRENPSQRYLELINQYEQLHVEGEKNIGLSANQTFPGQSLIPQAPNIKNIIKKTNAKSILDYGSGKGVQYTKIPVIIKDTGKKYNSIPEYWGIDKLKCYDPCYAPFNKLPSETFDGVICTDVLEHCPEEDIDWIIKGLFSFATRFVYANIACYPAKKTLPNGENAHCTIQPIQWWEHKIIQISKKYPDIIFEFWLDTKSGEKSELKRQKISNFN